MLLVLMASLLSREDLEKIPVTLSRLLDACLAGAGDGVLYLDVESVEIELLAREHDGLGLPECVGDDRERVRDAVLGVLEGQLCHAGETRHGSVRVALVHGVRTRSERRAGASAIGRVPRPLAVDHV